MTAKRFTFALLIGSVLWVWLLLTLNAIYSMARTVS